MNTAEVFESQEAPEHQTLEMLRVQDLRFASCVNQNQSLKRLMQPKPLQPKPVRLFDLLKELSLKKALLLSHQTATVFQTKYTEVFSTQ